MFYNVRFIAYIVKKIIMYKFYLTFLLLTYYNVIFSQEQSIKFNDSIIHYENLPLNNAISYENKFENTTNTTNQFLYNEYKNCIILYDGNLYYDVKLKFDIYTNKVLYKPKFNLVTEVALFNEYVDYFIIENRKFVKFIINDEYKFYEEIKINPTTNLYVMYKKRMKENYNGEFLRYDFYNELDVFITLDNSFKSIKNKKEIIEIFPNNKKSINEFYNNNNPLREANIVLFYTNLFKEILQKNE